MSFISLLLKSHFWCLFCFCFCFFLKAHLGQSNVMPAENLVLHISRGLTWCRFKTLLHHMFGVITGATWHTSQDSQPYPSVMLCVVR